MAIALRRSTALLEERIVTGAPKVLGFIDAAAVAATKPDVIIATGEIEHASYTKLSAIAPTITRPEGTAARVWGWPNQLTWIGRILDRPNTAAELISSARSQLDGLRNQHPAFDGKTIAAVYLSDTGTAAALCESNITDYLQGLGFRYNQTCNAVRVTLTPCARHPTPTTSTS